jgi:hypothetical protein
MVISSNDPTIAQPVQPGVQTATPGNSGTSPTSPKKIKNAYKPTDDPYFCFLILLSLLIPLPFFSALIPIIFYL